MGNIGDPCDGLVPFAGGFVRRPQASDALGYRWWERRAKPERVCNVAHPPDGFTRLSPRTATEGGHLAAVGIRTRAPGDHLGEPDDSPKEWECQRSSSVQWPSIGRGAPAVQTQLLVVRLWAWQQPAV